MAEALPQSDNPANEGPTVCHLLSAAVIGGAENLVVHLSNIHARHGNNSHVIIMEDPGPLSPRFNPKVNVHYLNYRRSSIRNPFRFITSLVNGYRLFSKTIDEEGIQVFQSHLPGTNLWGWLLHLTGKCKTVITVHSNQFLSGKFGTRFGKWATFQSYRLMPRSCGAMIAVSRKVKSSLVEQLGLSPEVAGKISFIENGIPMPGTIDPSVRKSLREFYEVPQNAVWIVAAGRMAEPKNFSCLIRCADWLKKHQLEFKILIAGEGPLREELHNLVGNLDVGDVVAMPGNVDNLQDIFLSADVFAIPSLWEGLPLVLIEAMASGLPVVGSRVPGVEDIIEHGNNGLLSKVSDEKALGNDILALAEDKALRFSLGDRGRLFAQENFDIEDTYRKYLNVYEQLV